MRPDWKDAPEWAKWLAADSDGCWYWFELEPQCQHGIWRARDGWHETASVLLNPHETLETRPAAI